jgi:hypothetical protein
LIAFHVWAILRKLWVKAQKHDKMDGAEKLLSISQCRTTVVYSVTVLSAWSGSFLGQTWLTSCEVYLFVYNFFVFAVCFKLLNSNSRHFGTCARHFGTKTNRHLIKINRHFFMPEKKYYNIYLCSFFIPLI